MDQTTAKLTVNAAVGSGDELWTMWATACIEVEEKVNGKQQGVG